VIVDIATGEVEEAVIIEPPTAKARRKAGRLGGPARARTLTPEERQDIARVAAEARWKKGR
jgi:hypothetical protein